MGSQLRLLYCVRSKNKFLKIYFNMLQQIAESYLLTHAMLSKLTRPLSACGLCIVSEVFLMAYF